MLYTDKLIQICAKSIEGSGEEPGIIFVSPDVHNGINKEWQNPNSLNISGIEIRKHSILEENTMVAISKDYWREEW